MLKIKKIKNNNKLNKIYVVRKKTHKMTEPIQRNRQIYNHFTTFNILTTLSLNNKKSNDNNCKKKQTWYNWYMYYTTGNNCSLQIFCHIKEYLPRKARLHTATDNLKCEEVNFNFLNGN